MSAPVMLACAATAVALGIPVISAAAHLEASHRAAAAADAAALAAADAASGWIAGEPCVLASQAAGSMGASVERCVIESATLAVQVEVTIPAPLGTVTAVARAGQEYADPGPGGPVGANGWAWPSSVRGITQSFHDGYSIDLSVGGGGELFAPHDGVVVRVGPDGGGLPGACVTNPEWWRGPNHSIVMRHEVEGKVLFSSHNHIAAGSPESFGLVPGTPVAAGQRVATVGMSGCTSGLHTHFTLSTKNSNAFPDVNPFDYLGEP